MLDETCVLEMTGAGIVEALENSCSAYPALEGRFAQVSGLAYAFDAARPAGSRVVSVEIPRGTPLVSEKNTACARSVLALGKDGYDSFAAPGVRTLRTEEESPLAPTAFRNHLVTLDVLNALSANGAAEEDAEEDEEDALVRRAVWAFARGSETVLSRVLARAAATRKDGSSRRGEGRSPLAGSIQSPERCASRRASTDASSHSTRWKTSGGRPRAASRTARAWRRG